MREILFKAKRTDNGKWVMGYIATSYSLAYIILPLSDGNFKWYNVDPSTPCQYTGLTDRHGRKIWENDVVKILSGEDGYFKVEWEEDTARWIMNNVSQEFIVHFDNYWAYEVEVVGSIFDNPELPEDAQYAGGGTE